MNQSIGESFLQLQSLLELSLEEAAVIFRLSADDLKSVELGLLPLDHQNFKRRVLHLKELTDFLSRKRGDQSLAELFKTQNKELSNQSPLEILMNSQNDEAFYTVSGFFFRSFK